MLEVKTLLVHILPYIPFLSAAVIKPSGEASGVGVVITRLVEAGIIGAIILYANLQVLEQKFADVKDDVSSCITSEAFMRSELEEQRLQMNLMIYKLETLTNSFEKHSNHSEN